MPPPARPGPRAPGALGLPFFLGEDELGEFLVRGEDVIAPPVHHVFVDVLGAGEDNRRVRGFVLGKMPVDLFGEDLEGGQELVVEPEMGVEFRIVVVQEQGLLGVEVLERIPAHSVEDMDELLELYLGPAAGFAEHVGREADVEEAPVLRVDEFDVEQIVRLPQVVETVHTPPPLGLDPWARFRCAHSGSRSFQERPMLF